MKERIKNLLNLDDSLSKTDIHEKIISLENLSETCLAIEQCAEACQKCSNYGKLWTCPPFFENVRTSYNEIEIIVCRIPTIKGMSMADCLKTMYEPVKEIVHRVLLEREKECHGIALSFAGSCSFCKAGICSRVDNLPCRHPELARRSLEGIGFDVGKILETYFGIKLEWSQGENMPEYLTFVAGVMY
ncbi:MAG: DUF2284 domain-containing protein [Muribaculaceae bacterium]|nr:DUF2284 domain-containing protein [Muribaculaceae bacterium]